MPTPTAQTPLRVEGYTETREVRQRGGLLGWLLGWVYALATLIPWMKDNAKNRSTRKQIQAVGVGLSVLALVLGRADPVLFALGMIGVALSLSLPIDDARRRAILRRIKAWSRVVTTARAPVVLVHDGRRLELRRGEELVRRVLTNRVFTVVRGRATTRVAMLVYPAGPRKKRETIGVLLTDVRASGEEAEAIGRSDLDTPVFLDAEAWAPLQARLDAALDAAR